jgi:16S rRNA (guanine(966)-N(2))-methyltransferase RsmD
MRVISGIYKGRILSSPISDTEVRPTTDRAKETLFNILTNRYSFEHKYCLDIFCGTGSLGIEFLSRGGAGCTFVDSDLKTIKQNISLLKLENNSHSVRSEAILFLKANTDKKFDFIFADPPYSYKKFADLLPAVSVYNSILILEHDKNFSAGAEFEEYVFLTKKIGFSNFTFFDFNKNYEKNHSSLSRNF